MEEAVAFAFWSSLSTIRARERTRGEKDTIVESISISIEGARISLSRFLFLS
jgi:hypothetical protein